MENTIDIYGDELVFKSLISDDFSQTSDIFYDDQITDISSACFINLTNLKELYLPNLTSIPLDGIAFTKIEKIVTPNVASLGNHAFRVNRFLKEITLLNDNITSLPSDCFTNNELLHKFSSYPDGVCRFNNVTTIGQGAFVGCKSIIEFNFPSCTTIGVNSFSDCYSATNFNFPNCTSIGQGAFSSCKSALEFNFPNCTTIGNSVFYNCEKVLKIKLLSSTRIDDRAFYGCSKLNRLEINNASSFASYCFYNCKQLTILAIHGTNSVVGLGSSSMFNQMTNLKIYVPDSLVDSYKTATNWSTYASKIKPLSELPSDE